MDGDEDPDGDLAEDDSRIGHELAAVRAAVAELTEMVNELVRRQRGEETG